MVQSRIAAPPRLNPNLEHALHDFESRLESPSKAVRDVVNGATMLETILGRKDDQDKLDWTLLPFGALKGIVKVLMFGERKYARDNWKHVPDAKNRYKSAFLRHYVEYQEGNPLDEESGLPHLYHMGCCLLFLIWFEEQA
jgi:hypothetical protein